ncbi:hypothetical protein [Streptomyces sp. CB01373]|uniref:hypothetical protein n=1 Tax=Streptomyces sp. CB01373 TaxID=2020325 RepID=UPI000CAC18FB|nr:hypothetical protein [Streptomyces sp. CB01373]PJM93899.1 hypothetical protein CG719_20625 [Streptomyces sp. CB01373]
MAIEEFDVIVMGARCAGSPTAMLFAQAGYRVLPLDRAGFPADTLSTLNGCCRAIEEVPAAYAPRRHLLVLAATGG